MSHWKKYTNNVLKNPDMKIFQKALNNLNLDMNQGIKSVSNSYGKAAVDFALTKNGKVLSLGFKKQADGLLELNGDFWTTGIRESTFIDQLSQQYNKEMIISKLQKTSQYSVSHIETNKNGEIELLVNCL